MRMVIKRHRTGWVVWDTLRNKPHDVRPIDKARAQALADGINARLAKVTDGFRRA